ncbi:MAG: hypothetical protein RIB71_21815 [Imperialibacter sp.]|uniref:hypothetical protein n=1 Tax=Imperialibacter sp. TaxID=2038411 RepID=UPI0032EFD811
MNTVVKKSLISTGILAALIYVILQLFDFPNLTHQAGHTHDPCNGCDKLSTEDKGIRQSYLYHNVVSGETMLAFNTRGQKVNWERMRFDWFILNRYCADTAIIEIMELGVKIAVAYDLCKRPIFGNCGDCHDHVANRPDFPSIAIMNLKPDGRQFEGEVSAPHLFGNIYERQDEWGLIKAKDGEFVYFVNTKNTPLEIGKEVAFRLEQFSIEYGGKPYFFDLAFDVVSK